MTKTNKFATWLLTAVLLASAFGVGFSFLREARKPLFGMGENPQTMAIETYIAGDNQPTHPSVVDMKEPWNGYRYWMAYSPYPYAQGEEENPCIAVSNDLEHWTVPAGLHNPIAFNEETSCDELKDPHMVYNPEKDQMEVWYLGRINGTLASTVPLSMFRKTSSDGVHWSPYELLIDNYNGKLSHSVIWEEGRYKLYGIKPSYNTTNSRLVLSESEDGLIWSAERELSFANRNTPGALWHGSVSHDSVYRFVSVASPYATSVEYSESKDGIHFTHPRTIITMGNYRNHFYRPHSFVADSMFVCIYGVVDYSNKWGLAMSTGKSPDEIKTYEALKPGFNHVMYRYRVFMMLVFKQMPWKLVGMLLLLSIGICVAAKGKISAGLLCLVDMVIIWLFKDTASISSVIIQCLALLLSGIVAVIITLISFGSNAVFRNKL